MEILSARCVLMVTNLSYISFEIAHMLVPSGMGPQVAKI